MPSPDGTLERLIPLVSEWPTSYWNESLGREGKWPKAAALLYYFRRLREMPSTTGEEGVDDGTGQPMPHAPRKRPAQDSSIVECTPEANVVWIHWFNDNLDRIRAAGELPAGYHQKLPSQVARTALVLHALWNPESPRQRLTTDTMAHTATLGGCYRTHIHRSLTLLGHQRPIPGPDPTLAEQEDWAS